MAGAAITIRLSRKTMDALARIATLTRRTNSDLAVLAIEAYVAREQTVVDSIQAGLDDLQAGRTMDHDSVRARLQATSTAAERV